MSDFARAITEELGPKLRHPAWHATAARLADQHREPETAFAAAIGRVLDEMAREGAR